MGTPFISKEDEKAFFCSELGKEKRNRTYRLQSELHFCFVKLLPL